MSQTQLANVQAKLLLSTHHELLAAAQEVEDCATIEGCAYRMATEDGGNPHAYCQHVLDRLAVKIRHNQAIAAAQAEINVQSQPAYSVRAIQTLRRAAMALP